MRKNRIIKLEKRIADQDETHYIISPEFMEGEKCVSVQRWGKPIEKITRKEFEALGIPESNVMEIVINFV